jgi:hypothetical protein
MARWPRNQSSGPNGGLSTGPGGGLSTGPWRSFDWTGRWVVDRSGRRDVDGSGRRPFYRTRGWSVDRTWRRFVDRSRRRVIHRTGWRVINGTWWGNVIGTDTLLQQHSTLASLRARTSETRLTSRGRSNCCSLKGRARRGLGIHMRRIALSSSPPVQRRITTQLHRHHVA